MKGVTYLIPGGITKRYQLAKNCVRERQRLTRSKELKFAHLALGLGLQLANHKLFVVLLQDQVAMMLIKLLSAFFAGVSWG